MDPFLCVCVFSYASGRTTALTLGTYASLLRCYVTSSRCVWRSVCIVVCVVICVFLSADIGANHSTAVAVTDGFANQKSNYLMRWRTPAHTLGMYVCVGQLCRSTLLAATFWKTSSPRYSHRST